MDVITCFPWKSSSQNTQECTHLWTPAAGAQTSLPREQPAAVFCHVCFVSGPLPPWAEQAGEQPAGWPLVMDISWNGRRASMLLRAEEQFGRAEERRVSFTDDKWWSPRMRHGAYCPVGGPGCPEPTSVLQAADASVRS